MSFPFFRKPWRLLPGVVAAILTLGLTQLEGFEDLEQAHYRWLFQIRGARPWDERIALITIDDKTLAALGQFPLPRSTYTHLLDRLAPGQPVALGFNIMFVEPSQDDGDFAAAMAEAGHVVLASGIDPQGQALPPNPQLLTAAVATGHILKRVERDGLVHTVDPWRIQQTALGITLAEGYALRQTPIPLPSLDHPLRINWPGPAATLAQYSLVDVLSGQVPPQVFDGKVVIVGVTATGTDALTTPFDSNPPTHGSLMQAAILDNALQQRYLRSLDLSLGWWLLLLAMPGISYGLMGRPLRWQLCILAGSLAGWSGSSLLLFAAGYWLPTVPPLVLLGLTGVGAMGGQQLRTNWILQRLLEDLWQYHRRDTSFALSPPASSQAMPEDLGREVQKLVLLANSLGWTQATQTAIAQTVPVGLVAVDEADQVWFCNPLATRYLGVSLGSPFQGALVPQWLAGETWQTTRSRLLTGQAIAPVECQQDHTWFELRFELLPAIPQPSPLLAEGRRGFLVLVADVTHRKAIEVGLRHLNQGLANEVRQRAQDLEKTNLDLVREISERRQVQEQLAHQALHDELTGLPNRAYLKTQLTTLLRQAQTEPGYQFAVLFIDCDRFKLVNDSFGHLVGDELLKAIAQRLRHCIARTDMVARFGGDEFTILLTHIPSPEAPIKVAQRIQQQLQKPFRIGDRQLYTGGSIGIVLSRPGYQHAEDMLRDADTAMYRAKRGKLGFTFFKPEMHQAVRASLQLETDLRQSQQRQELVVHYQPIVGLKTQAIEGFEALVRWQHPRHGLIGPDQFIPIAEESGLIIQIGQWVLHEACRQLRHWQQEQRFAPDVFMSVNLSVQQFNEANLLSRIDATLRDTHLESQYLKLEITESAIMANSDLAVQTFHHLKDRGIHLGIDDFGTGYSSLNYLHCFPIDVLKVDRSFIHRMVEGEKYLSLVQVIRTLAHHFNMTMIAEGIETELQINYLKAMDCGLGQGFFFCPPLDHQALEAQYQQPEASLQWGSSGYGNAP